MVLFWTIALATGVLVGEALGEDPGGGGGAGPAVDDGAAVGCTVPLLPFSRFAGQVLLEAV